MAGFRLEEYGIVRGVLDSAGGHAIKVGNEGSGGRKQPLDTPRVLPLSLSWTYCLSEGDRPPVSISVSTS